MTKNTSGRSLLYSDTLLHEQLDNILSSYNEPDITLGTDENLVGLDHAGLVVWEFSDSDVSSLCIYFVYIFVYILVKISSSLDPN